MDTMHNACNNAHCFMSACYANEGLGQWQLATKPLGRVRPRFGFGRSTNVILWVSPSVH